MVPFTVIEAVMTAAPGATPVTVAVEVSLLLVTTVATAVLFELQVMVAPVAL